MPATKRKRTYTRRPYRRRTRSRGPSLKSLFQDLPPRGPGTPNFTKYGPNRRQMSELGVGRTMAQSRQRLLDNYKGAGDYMQAGEMIGGALGAMSGAAIGGIETVESLGGGAAFAPYLVAGGATMGAGLGGGIGHSIDQYIGQGDYGRAANQIVTGSREPISVNQGADRTGDIYIKQTEFIGNLTVPDSNSKDFKLESYALNPGNKTLFPFLSQIAHNYELYEWVGLMVMFKPTTGEGGSKNQLGKVVLTTNYDPNCKDFSSSLEMQNYDYSSSGKPSQTIVHGIETAARSRATRMMYVRETFDTSRDKEFTDIGKLFIATEGTPEGGVLGELHVTYTCRLSRAKLFAHLGESITHQEILVDLSCTDNDYHNSDAHKSIGDELLEVVDSSLAGRIRLRLKDKNVVQKSIRVTCHMTLDTALTGSDVEFPFISDHSDEWERRVNGNVSLDGSTARLLSSKCRVGEKNAMLIHEFTLDNPNDANPHIDIAFHVDGDETGGVAPGDGQFLILIEEIAHFELTEKFLGDMTNFS